MIDFGEILFKALIAGLIIVTSERFIVKTLWKGWEVDPIKGFISPTFKEVAGTPRFIFGVIMIIGISMVIIFPILSYLNSLS